MSGYACWRNLWWRKDFRVTAESMKINKIVVGAPNKSGRHCKRSGELQLIYLMYLDLSGTKRCPFWRHLPGWPVLPN